MTVAEMPMNARDPAVPAVCRMRVWPLPAESAHRAERGARTIIRDVLTGAGTRRDDVLETETIVAELAINALQHAVPPFELRVVFVGRAWPTWCEIADGGTDVERVQRRLTGVADVPELTTRGRGLVMVHGLSAGRCAAYLTMLCQSKAAGKAVGFALPGAGRVA